MLLVHTNLWRITRISRTVIPITIEYYTLTISMKYTTTTTTNNNTLLSLWYAKCRGSTKISFSIGTNLPTALYWNVTDNIHEHWFGHNVLLHSQFTLKFVNSFLAAFKTWYLNVIWQCCKVLLQFDLRDLERLNLVKFQFVWFLVL